MNYFTAYIGDRRLKRGDKTDLGTFAYCGDDLGKVATQELYENCKIHSVAKTKKAGIVVERGPRPVKRESRICFAVAWFDSAEDAYAFAKANPGSYNGGWYHGMSTGRDLAFDHEKDGRRFYASTY